MGPRGNAAGAGARVRRSIAAGETPGCGFSKPKVSGHGRIVGELRKPRLLASRITVRRMQQGAS